MAVQPSPRTNSSAKLDLNLNVSLRKKTRVSFGHTVSAAVLNLLKDNQHVNIFSPMSRQLSYRFTIKKVEVFCFDVSKFLYACLLCNQCKLDKERQIFSSPTVSPLFCQKMLQSIIIQDLICVNF